MHAHDTCKGSELGSPAYVIEYIQESERKRKLNQEMLTSDWKQ